MASALENVTALAASRQLSLVGANLAGAIKHLIASRSFNQSRPNRKDVPIPLELGAKIRIANQGRRNASEASTYLQVADGLLEEVAVLLGRGSALCQQAQKDGLAKIERTAMDVEFQHIVKAVTNIWFGSRFNGIEVFNTYVGVRVAVGKSAWMDVTVGSLYQNASTALGLNPAVHNLLIPGEAAIAANQILSATETVVSTRSKIEVNRRQMDDVWLSLGIQVENLTAVSCDFRHASIVDELIALTQFQLLNQSWTHALEQANQQSRSIVTQLQTQE